MRKILSLTALCFAATAAWALGEVRVDLFGQMELQDIAAQEPLKWQRFKHYEGKPQYLKSAMLLSKPLTDKWQKFEFSFVPAHTGTVSIMFHVPGSRKKENIKPVLIDDVKSTGSEVKNGGFELLKEERKASGWTFLKLAALITGDDAAEGKNYVRVSDSDGAAAQTITVQRGERVTVTFKAKLPAAEKSR